MRRGGVDLVVVGRRPHRALGRRREQDRHLRRRVPRRTLHGVPFYVAAPWSTVDLACPDGDAIPIEQRSDARGALRSAGAHVAPEGVRADNPAFDVTPARLVRAIFTERGEVARRRASPRCARASRVLDACDARAPCKAAAAVSRPSRRGSRSARPAASATPSSRRRSAASTSTRSARRRAARTSASAGARGRRP